MTMVKRRGGKRMHAGPTPTVRYWAIVRDDDPDRMPCLWGARIDAEENCDPDERVVEVEVRIVRTVEKNERVKFAASPF